VLHIVQSKWFSLHQDRPWLPVYFSSSSESSCEFRGKRCWRRRMKGGEGTN
jgi:hypothetical protein